MATRTASSHRTHSILRRLPTLLALLLAAAFALLAGPRVALARDYDIVRVNVEATVREDGTLVVPQSATDSILPSITRRSLVQVAEEYLGMNVEQSETGMVSTGMRVARQSCRNR